MRQSRTLRRIRLVAVVAALPALLGVAQPAGAAPPSPPPGPGTPAAKSSVTWSVAPGTDKGPDGRAAFTFEADPGQTLRDVVAVSNFSAAPATFRVYASDAVNTPTGGFDLLAGDRKPTDVGAWVALTQSTVTIPANATVNVPFTLAIPANGTPGDHAGGIVAALQRAGQGPVVVENRIGARIYLRVHGKLAPSLGITRIDARYHHSPNPFAGGDVTVEYTLRNTGNVRLAAAQLAAVTGASGGRLASAAGPPVAELLPGQSLQYTVTIRGVAPLGPLGADVTVTPSAVKGDRYTESLSAAGLGTGRRRAGLFAMPWSQLVLLVLLAALVVLAVIVLRRRRRAAARTLAAAVERGRLEERRAAADRLAASRPELESEPARMEEKL
nr:hypothetical protein GCM10020063_007920 [Dactylosporangium thailandense]